jgi:hypothetical protein
MAWLHRTRHNRPLWQDLQDSEAGRTRATERILVTCFGSGCTWDSTR